MKELVIIERPDIVSIADSIRNKTGQNKELTIGEMIDCINDMGSGGIDTSDATATANDLAQGKTAYVNGEKVTGTFTVDDEIVNQDNLLAQLSEILENKSGVNVDNMINAPELCTVTWEVVDNRTYKDEDILIDFVYNSINDSNTIQEMTSSGMFGSVTCIPGWQEVWARYSNEFSLNQYGILINDILSQECFIRAGAILGDNSNWAIYIPQSCHLVIKVS